MISRAFTRDETTLRYYAMEELKYCTYSGGGGLTSLNSFMSKFRTVMIHISEAGGLTDDNNFILQESFAVQFKRIPEFKESVHVIERSKLTSKYHRFAWQWKIANAIMDNLMPNQKHKLLLAGCNINNSRFNAAAAGAEEPSGENSANMAAVGANGKELKQVTKEEWGKQRERFKETACPRAIKALPCPYHDEGGKCYYNHEEKIVAKAKSKVIPKAKAKGKDKDKGK